MKRKISNREKLLWDEFYISEKIPVEHHQPVALVYPNSYRVGMSSLGFLTAYAHIVDSGYRPLRFFHDIRDSKNRPVAIETGTPLGNFEKIAFHFSFELDYINAVEMLQSSGVNPLREKRRSGEGSFILAGGIAPSGNPLPLANFMDAVFIGEMESIIDRRGSIDLDSINSFTTKDGWFIPEEYFSKQGNYSVKHKLSKKWHEYESYSPILTRHSVFSMMNLIEISRGCPIKCKFCLAGSTHGKVRERSVELIYEMAMKHREISDKVGLIGSIPTLHSGIIWILDGLLNRGLKPSVSSVSVSSLNPDTLALLAKGGMKTLTLGVESFDNSVQRKVGKKISLKKLQHGIETAMRNGMQDVKLYLMLGLPGAKDDEEIEIIERMLELKSRIHLVRPSTNISISVNPFVPKPRTPFAAEDFMGEDEFRKKIAIIKKELGRKGISVKSESHRGAFLQYLLSCSDERIGDIIVSSIDGGNLKKRLENFTENLNEYLIQSISKVDRLIK